VNLVERLLKWIDGVRKVQDEGIPLNGNALIEVLTEAASHIESQDKRIRELEGALNKTWTVLFMGTSLPLDGLQKEIEWLLSEGNKP